MSHSAMSIADSASVKMPPGPQHRRVPLRSLATIVLDPQRILAHGQRGEFLDRGVQAAASCLPP